MTIVDYASPRPRSKLRLASKSRILCQYDADRMIVVERLEARGEAIGGICFAVFILIYLGMIVVGGGNWSAVVVIGPAWLAEAIVMLMVIHQTWRTTLLTATRVRLQLQFRSPVYRKEYVWNSADVVSVLNGGTANPSSEEPLSELRIRISNGQDIRLFTDHRSDQIEELATAIRGAIAGEA